VQCCNLLINYFRFILLDACCDVGIVTLAEELDYESHRQYHLEIAVYQLAVTGQPVSGQSVTTGHTTDRLTSVQLTIELVNVNDHAPQFSHKEYLVFLSEDSDVGSFVVKLVATDADSCHGD